MGRRRGFIGICWLVAFAGISPAQTAPYDAVIRQPVAEVRGGKSTIYPVTGTLRAGQPVRVLRDEDGWLAVTPPSGSSSWVMDRFLKFDPPAQIGRRAIAIVLADDTPVLLGGPNSPAPLPHEVARLKRGTQVVTSGEKVVSDLRGEKAEWWRIEPNPSEIRWVAKEAVTQSNVVMSAAGNAARDKPLPALWLQAEQAERAGSFAQAESMYRQLASEQGRAGGDQELAIRCWNRVEIIRQRSANMTYATRPSGPTTGTFADSSSTAPPTGNLTAAPAGPVTTSGPGWLRRASFQIDGKPVYVLEDLRGQPRTYAVAQNGMTLDPYVNRSVEMFGALIPRPDLTIGNYMTVNRLHLLK